ncbi:MAG: LysR substrate-binding domain-containing protein [Rhodocyclaceae bacterium]|nr:LysR substrate-binding domain-containing protein [Rhodocyclaceae bacterium]
MPKRNLDMEALRALVAIADTASFSTAALQLGRTQSAISLQIKRLEAMLGQTLLRRVQGRVDGATAEGRAFISYARQILRLNDEAYSAVAEDTAAGTLRVGLPEELMESVFPAAMSRYQALYPRMRLRLQSDVSANLRQGLDSGELDLILFKHCDRSVPASASSVWQEPLVWMAGEAYAADLPTPVPLALFGENCAFRIAATGALAKAGLAWQLTYSGSSTTGLRHAVRCGLGITALPGSLLIPGMVVVEAGLPGLPNARIAARHAPGEVHPAADRFVALLGEEIRSQRGMPTLP